MSAEQNVVVMGRYLDAVNRNDAPLRARPAMEMTEADFPHLHEFYDENIVVSYPGTSELAGEYRGRKQFLEDFGRKRLGYNTVSRETVDMLVSDDRICLILKEHLMRADGESIDVIRHAIYTLVNGKMTEIRIFDNDQDMVDRFLAPAAQSASSAEV